MNLFFTVRVIGPVYYESKEKAAKYPYKVPDGREITVWYYAKPTAEMKAAYENKKFEIGSETEREQR